MILFPNAKINLGLNVVRKRSDGFHDLETVFYPVSLCDILEVVKSDKFKIDITGISINGASNNNLIVKAYNILKKEFDLPPVHIHLHKVIPLGAGLGGGSSDGAFMLKLLNELFSLELEIPQLEKYALLLGADCPFFIRNIPAFASGIGEILSPIKIDLSDFFVVLVKPPYSVNTAEAYKNIVPQIPGNSIKNILKDSTIAWKGNLVNNFEKPVFSIYPEVLRIKEQLYKLGAEFALMSGSGSTVFGLFPHLPVDLDKYFPEDYFIYR